MVGFGALWITGLSLILASLSYAEFAASTSGLRFREVYRRRGYQVAFNAGLFLVCMGLIGSARAIWEQVVWALLALAFAFYAFQALRRQVRKENMNS